MHGADDGDGDVPEENGDCGGDQEDWDDEQDLLQLERRMADRRRAMSLPATFFDADAPPNGEARKRVKFADSIGLDLASVKHFSTLEDPQIPTKVLSRFRGFSPRRWDLPGVGVGDPRRVGLGSGSTDLAAATDRLVRCFPQPVESSGFEARLRDLRVCLERVTVTRSDVRGHIRVYATCPSGEVGVRYTFNDWRSHVDAQAQAADPDPNPDPRTPSLLVGERFAFTMYTPPWLDTSSSVHFAVYLRCDEGYFWDNREGRNYTLKCRGFPPQQQPPH